MIKSNGGVFGRNPTFNDVTVDGNLTVNGDIALGDDIVVADSLTVQGTTASTSTTTGALRVTGGVGIGGALYTGANAVINGVSVGAGQAGTDNTVLGNGAGAALAAGGDRNTLIGRGAGDVISTADDNVIVGTNALGSTNGSQNTVIGSQALEGDTTASGNVAVGWRALRMTGGVGSVNNVAIGINAQVGSGQAVTNVVAIGTNAALFSRANDTVAIGSEVLDNNTLGTANVAVGRSALGAATSSIATFTTTPVAAGSGYTANQTGVTVTLVKKSGADTFTGTVQAALTTDGSGAVTAVQAAPVSAGSTFTGSNVIFEPSGFGAGSGCEISIATLATAGGNTAVGHQAGLSLTTATNCTLVGAGAGDALTTGSGNTFLGVSAGGAATSLVDSVAIGLNALSAATSGTNNQVAIGRLALANLSSGSDNVAIGQDAGRRVADATNLTTANGCVLIGVDARPSINSTNYEIVIGPNGRGDGQSTTSIGRPATTTQARLYGGTFLSTGLNGQSTQLGQSTTLLSGLTGATVTATNLIPANSILLGVTARVTTAITGATTFDIGDGVTADRFGNDVAIALNTTSQNAIAPALFAAANNVVLTANGSNFTGGAVRLTAHFMTLVAPTS